MDLGHCKLKGLPPPGGDMVGRAVLSKGVGHHSSLCRQKGRDFRPSETPDFYMKPFSFSVLRTKI